MFELLFLCGIFGLALGAVWEYVTALPAFPTIMVASISTPLLAWGDYLKLVDRLQLVGMSHRRPPVPPERFYWPLGRRQLGWMMGHSGVVAAVAWPVAIRFPADFAPNGEAITGWVAGIVAVGTSARFCSSAIAYVRASQWFDKMAPWVIGWCRRSLYRISENPDFLASENPKKHEEKKSVY